MNEFPATTDKIPEDPQVKIHFRGLGVLCFSKDHNRAEIGYVDVPCDPHDAMIEITASDENTIIPYGSMRGKQLEIKTADGGMGRVFHADGDLRSYRNTIELSDFYGPAAEFADNVSFQSKIFMDGMVFFTDKDSQKKVTPFELNNPSRKLEPRTVGLADHAYPESKVISVKLDSVPIPLDPERRYDIFINSNCRGVTESDFKHYYNFLKNHSAPQYNLEYEDDKPARFTEAEIEELRPLVGHLDDFFKDRSRLSDAELIGKISHFMGIRCAPEPCLRANFINRPRNLP